MRVLITLVVAVLAAGVPCSFAQDYPTKPIRLIVPFAPGGVADIVARLLGQRLAESLGQTIVVDNRPGAGGVVGSDIVAKSAPDGYALVLQDMAYTISPAVYSKVPYDPINDFTPITLVARMPQWLFVNSGVAARNVTEFVALAKAQPAKFTIGSSGNGSGTHLMAEMLKRNAGINLTHVPYKGAGPAVAATLAGEISSLFTFMPAAISHVQSGRLRAIGVTTSTRQPSQPDVPTFDESGIPNMVLQHWLGIMAPAGLPSPILVKLNKEVTSAVHSPSVVERYKTLILEPATGTPQEFRLLIETDLSRWAKVVKDAGIRAD